MRMSFMKRSVLIFMLVTGLLIAITACSYSMYEGSNPADGEIVTEPIQDIEITFSGYRVNEVSGITVESKNASFREHITDVEMNVNEPETTVIAHLTKPLSDDTYEVTWNIIDEYDYPVEGTFEFMVDTQTGRDAASAAHDDKSVKSPAQQRPAGALVTSSSKSKEEVNAIMRAWLIGVGLVLILLVAVIFSFNRLSRKK